MAKVNTGDLVKDFLSAIFYVVVILYLTHMTPQLPKMVKDLFRNDIFRVGILFMILVLVNISPAMALLVSIAFVVTMNNLQIEYFEASAAPEKEEKAEVAVSEKSSEELESEETGCFEQRTIDISKVSPSLENEGVLYGSI